MADRIESDVAGVHEEMSSWCHVYNFNGCLDKRCLLVVREVATRLYVLHIQSCTVGHSKSGLVDIAAKLGNIIVGSDPRSVAIGESK